MKKIVFLIMTTLLLVFCLNSSEVEKREITLQEAIAESLKNNLDLQIETTNADYSKNTLKINSAIFIPTLSSYYRSEETNTPNTDYFSGADVVSQKTDRAGLTLSQKIPLGGTFDTNIYYFKRKTNSIWANVNPQIYTQVEFKLTQPLLKGFGTSNTKKDIRIAVNNLQTSRLQVRQRIDDLVYSVEDAYWGLLYAHKNLEAKKVSLTMAKDLLKRNEIKVRVGTAAPIDILEAKAEVASYESQVIQAELSIKTAEENLKKILNISAQNVALIPSDTMKVRNLLNIDDQRTFLNPSESQTLKPVIPPVTADLNAFLLEAMKQRPDVKKAKLELKNNNINVKYFRNQMLPDLQLVASYYTIGTGGDRLIFAGEGEDRHIVGAISKGFWDTMEESWANTYKNYSLELQFKMPLSFSKEKAQLAQAKINMKKAFLSLKNVENTVYSEVKDVIKELEANTKLVEANRIRLKLENEKLKAEIKKLSVGISSNYEVLIMQRDFANAQTNLLQSIKDYLMTLAKIDRVLSRTLKTHNIKFKNFLTTKDYTIPEIK